MKLRLIGVAVALLCVAVPARGHRLDEYLQATTIGVQRDRIALRLRLTPGVDLAAAVIAGVDSNGDGVLSRAEQVTFAERIRRDLLLSIDGVDRPLRFVSSTCAEVAEIRRGLGDIVLDFEADVPRGGASRRVIFENLHEPRSAVYLVNCLVPSDPGIHVTSQDRNYDQSRYELGYAVDAIAPATWLDRSGGRSLFKAFFYQGLRHILTGYDHLLFVSALVLAATTLLDLIKVVTAFTLAHTITLMLAAFNLVHLPERVVEPLIAASIVFVAVQNVFWPGRAKGWGRLGAAFFFGLFHGLGFAGGLLEAMRAMPSGTLVVALLAFSLGVEAGHQTVVLPLFGFLKVAREAGTGAVTRSRVGLAIQQVGSGGILVAGGYYLCLALGRALDWG